MYTIMGITGNVGGAAARKLLDEGHSLRALVRDKVKAAEWAKQGVELVEGDFEDAEAVARALRGAEAAFVMLPPFFAPSPRFAEAKAIIAGVREGLRASTPSRLVVLSSVGSEKSSDLGMITVTQLFEHALRDMEIPVAFVRAGSFFENYLQGYRAAVASGTYYSFWSPTDKPIPMVASADIGLKVAKLMASSWTGKKVVELGSQISPNELARAMSEAAGKDIVVRAVPREQWTSTLQSIGFPALAIAPYSEMVDSYNKGWIDFGVPGAEAAPATLTLAEFFRQVS